MDRIGPETFFFHFPSLLYASGRNLCYLCFQVERKRYPWHDYEYWDSGVFQNKEYRNVTLSIFTARLYYFWHSDFQDGLQRLYRAGVQVDIMCFEDYKYCWKNFVDNQGMPFQRRNLLKHYHHLARELGKILG
ncbi:DNA dC-_dU-editing enzyme APOBEC-3Ca-like [Lycaon pictus]